MPLLATNPFIRERIGVTGLDKVGKSTDILATALVSYLSHYAAAQGTDWSILQNQPIFWYVDLDRQCARYLFSSHYAQHRLLKARVIPTPSQAEAAYFNGYGNIVLFECKNHEELDRAVDTIMASARPDDWAVIDMINYAWEGIRDFYTRAVHQKSLADFELEAQKAKLLAKAKGKKGAGGKLDWNDWAAIKTGYNSVVRRLMMEGVCHFYTTFPADPLGEDESPEITQHWGAVGVKPKGIESNLQSQLRTILVKKRQTFVGYPPQYLLQTQTESGRPMLGPTPVSEIPGQGDFTQVYLQQIAGWQV